MSQASDADLNEGPPPPGAERRQHRRRRLRRHGRRAYIRSVYFLPSLATLGNAVCGFAAIYVSAMTSAQNELVPQRDPWANYLAHHSLSAAAYLVFGAMVFDALDGRLARFARHTTDFGGQLDSLADMLSFGAAPAFIALRLFKLQGPEDVPLILSRLIWAAAAMYVACAAIRLARFNVSNEHGEQHHFSFLGLPSPGAAGAVAAMVLMQQELLRQLPTVARIWAAASPVVVLAAGLLMISHLRYPHLVNRYLKGKRSIGRLILVLGIIFLLIAAHQYTLGIGTLAFAFWGPVAWVMSRVRRFRRFEAPPTFT